MFIPLQLGQVSEKNQEHVVIIEDFGHRGLVHSFCNRLRQFGPEQTSNRNQQSEEEKDKDDSADCTEENRAQVLNEVVRTARTQYGAAPDFTVQMIVVSGILHWTYEVQVCIGR